MASRTARDRLEKEAQEALQCFKRMNLHFYQMIPRELHWLIPYLFDGFETKYPFSGSQQSRRWFTSHDLVQKYGSRQASWGSGRLAWYFGGVIEWFLEYKARQTESQDGAWGKTNCYWDGYAHLPLSEEEPNEVNVDLNSHIERSPDTDTIPDRYLRRLARNLDKETIFTTTTNN
jgi:hypothetical protein